MISNDTDILILIIFAPRDIFSRDDITPKARLTFRNDWSCRKLVKRVGEYRQDMSWYHMQMVVRRYSRSYGDRSIVICQFPLCRILLRSTDPCRIKYNKLASERERVRFRSGGMYVTAAVNLMIYIGRRKTNEWIHLERGYGLTARLEVNIHESSRE